MTGPITTGIRAATETWRPSWREMQAEFGAPASLEDFERKAQMLDYVDHRAIFEGMNAHLWSPNSGRLLWMTQPAWPSNTWQILNSDYDTQSSFYGVKKACEPLHVQLDLSNYDVAVVNTTNDPHPGLLVTANVYSLDNKLLLHHEEKKDAARRQPHRRIQAGSCASDYARWCCARKVGVARLFRQHALG